MQISKTVVFAIINLTVAVLAALGVGVSPEMQAELAQHVDALIVAFFGVNGVVVWILRAWTSRPLDGLVQKAPE